MSQHGEGKTRTEALLCGTGTIAGYGAATSTFDITAFAPIGDTNCADLSAVRTISVTGGTGVFEGATGSGTDRDMPAGDSGHASLSGTLTLP